MAKVKERKKEQSNSLGELLFQLRKKNAFSMQKLANLTEISPAYICRIESGERKPSRELLEVILSHLIPNANQAEKDEVLIAAGYAPVNLKNFMGREDVLAIYQKSLAADPDNFKAYIGFITSLIRSQQYDLARQHIQQGMQKFDDMVQLQTLLATLEMSKGNYQQAITFQQEALRYYQSSKKRADLKLNDLLLSLGVMYFEQGNDFAYQRIEALNQSQEKQAKAHTKSALDALQAALTTFEDALKIDPDDVYILDELARVHFTLAYILPIKASQAHWKASIDAFEKTLYSSQKQVLGYEALLQSTAFLALAYSKSGNFPSAWFTINTIEACLPNYWLIHYIKACYFGLKIQSDYKGQRTKQSEPLFQSCLKTLATAFAVQDPNNRSQEEAVLEPDLEAVKKLCPKEWKALFRIKEKK